LITVVQSRWKEGLAKWLSFQGIHCHTKCTKIAELIFASLFFFSNAILSRQKLCWDLTLRVKTINIPNCHLAMRNVKNEVFMKSEKPVLSFEGEVSQQTVSWLRWRWSI
jgi:hypothetical protein